MKTNSFLFFRRAKPQRKFISLFLMTLMLVQTFVPTISYALTSGPTQPEVQTFEPVGTSDMVDLFSGDFKYNIPLLDVDGYPINLSYHSGVTMDEEASWVGLGWNINVGTVNRAMRGIPDDFAGDVIKKEMNMKSNNTYGISGGLDLELDGFPLKLSVGMGGKFNNYKGMSLEKSVNVSINSAQGMKGPLTGSIGLTSSTDEGLTIQPSLSLNTAGHNAEGSDEHLSEGLSIGTSFNSRAGLKQITIGTSITNNYSKHLNQISTSSSFDIGMPTYVFTGSMPMNTFSITGTFKLGTENPPISFPDYYANGYYVHQSLAQTEIDRPAYGYMNLDLGANNDQALLDFNRENDGEYQPNATPNLPVTNLTNDLFSVSGQGIGGSYRSLRSDVGYVFDPLTKTNSNAFNVSAEIGLGSIVHGGFDLGMTFTDTRCGRWIEGNALGSKLKYITATTNPLFEKYYLVEANEMPTQSNQLVENHFGGFAAVRPNLVGPNFNRVASASLSPMGNVTTNFRPDRESRNQVISIISGADKKKGFGIELLHPQAYNTSATDHHIGEIQVTGTDGSRYIYGIAAYNTMQKEVTFAIGDGLYQSWEYNDEPGTHTNANTGLIKDYPSDASSTGNSYGIDNYYSANTIPAYAHSFLLTDILSADYIDADNVQGPSDGDMGSYTKFYYSKHNSDDFKWRTPLISSTSSATDVASFNEGLKSDLSDDKANYVYGTKELWYLDSIVTKNYIAIFDKEPRQDGLGVLNENGKVDPDYAHAPRLLRSIRLYTKPAFRKDPVHASPIKVVNFEYSYSLCKNTPNSNATGGGKLTLTKVYFTYQSSQKGRLSPYTFCYGNLNPDYNSRCVDRWGNYKPNPSNASWLPDDNSNKGLSNADDPYVIQDPTLAAQYASVWQLDTIKLPSGGKITVKYESDDYAYIQNQRAGQMFKVVDYNNGPHCTFPNAIDVDAAGSINTLHLFFRLQPGYPYIKDYIGDLKYIYFKFLMDVLGPNQSPAYDFVSGYGEIGSDTASDAANNCGYITLKSVTLKDGGSSYVSPMTKCAIQFARLHLTRLVYGTPGDQDQNFGTAVINTVAQFFVSTITNIVGAAEGANGYLYAPPPLGMGIGHTAIMDKSWIRLYNPSYQKLGGGSRVKEIRVSDEWNEMTKNGEATSEYGQEYNYRDESNHSTGVASYEPQLGGDENSLKHPLFFDEKNLCAPDNKFYQETPIAESLYPSPSVGYSMVTVTNLQHQGVVRHTTGKVVHEFYTAKDFPTVAGSTDVYTNRDRTDPLSILKLFDIHTRDYVTSSQGFSVELNDMNGKPKKESVYQEGQTTPITTVEYYYKQQPYGVNSFRLENGVTVIHQDGTVSPAEVGVTFDMVGDMREEHDETTSAGMMLNVDFIPPYIPIPGPWPSYTNEKTQFRSATFTKVIQRFGILDKVVKRDLGSVVETENLAYDSQTGHVLLTKTTTDYNDSIFTMTFPADWYYDGMGQAYKSIGLTLKNASLDNITNAKQYFTPGDEVELLPSLGADIRGWVTDVQDNSVTMVDRFGAPIAGTYTIKIIRSGRRNLLDANMASVTTRTNPLNTIKTNKFSDVLQAAAQIYSDQWKTFCDCFPSPNINGTSNPYILGTKGNWRVSRAYTHLAPRSQSYYDNNTNIRNDGTFTSFTPFYKLVNSSWQKEENNWTYASEVTEFSPYGQELENRDALNRYSAATFGFNQTLPTAVSGNSQYRDIGFDSFEDYGFSPCADNHFKFPNSSGLDNTVSHTGRTSLSLTGISVVMTKKIINCQSQVCSLMFIPGDNSTCNNLTSISYTGANGNVQFTYNILSGDPSVSLNSTGTTLHICGGISSNYSVEVTISDFSGCQVTQIFNH